MALSLNWQVVESTPGRRALLREDAEDLIREHYRLHRQLAGDADDARGSNNRYVADVLQEQVDLHFQTAVTLDLLLEEI